MYEILERTSNFLEKSEAGRISDPANQSNFIKYWIWCERAILSDRVYWCQSRIRSTPKHGSSRVFINDYVNVWFRLKIQTSRLSRNRLYQEWNRNQKSEFFNRFSVWYLYVQLSLKVFSQEPWGSVCFAVKQNLHFTAVHMPVTFEWEFYGLPQQSSHGLLRRQAGVVPGMVLYITVQKDIVSTKSCSKMYWGLRAQTIKSVIFNHVQKCQRSTPAFCLKKEVERSFQIFRSPIEVHRIIFESHERDAEVTRKNYVEGWGWLLIPPSSFLLSHKKLVSSKLTASSVSLARPGTTFSTYSFLYILF